MFWKIKLKKCENLFPLSIIHLVSSPRCSKRILWSSRVINSNLAPPSWLSVALTFHCQKIALNLSCIIHDIDHRGYNNAFMIKNKSPLSHLYSTSTMEWHHFKQGVFILEVSESPLGNLRLTLPLCQSESIRSDEGLMQTLFYRSQVTNADHCDNFI